MQFQRQFLAALLAFAIAPAALAQTQRWAQLTLEDLAAAQKLLADNHPAAAPSHGDAAFQAALQSGYAEVVQRAGQVRTYEGYRAVMTQFAAAFGDRHISAKPLLAKGQRWPGFLVSLDSDWRVRTRMDGVGLSTGDRLLGCDGKAPEELAQLRLKPYTSNWDIVAQRKKGSYALFLDDGNPFIPAVTQCTFETSGGARVDHVLTWRPIGSGEVTAQSTTAIARPSRSVELARFGKGWWIRLGTLQDDARPVVEQVVANAASMHDGQVVVDLRGNGGGASVYTDRIAEVLYGRETVQKALERSAVGKPGSVWRVSPDNLKTLQQYVERFTRELGPQDPLVSELTDQLAAMTVALPKGEAFSYVPPPPVPREKEKAGARPLRPQVVLVTDRFCFSSCLLGANLFRELGAFHVGEPTDQNTHYTEVREIVLPSGLSTFSTMQAYDASMPRKVGPYTPAATFNGSIDDDQAVRGWVSSQLESGLKGAGAHR